MHAAGAALAHRDVHHRDLLLAGRGDSDAADRLLRRRARLEEGLKLRRVGDLVDEAGGAGARLGVAGPVEEEGLVQGKAGGGGADGLPEELAALPVPEGVGRREPGRCSLALSGRKGRVERFLFFREPHRSTSVGTAN